MWAVDNWRDRRKMRVVAKRVRAGLVWAAPATVAGSVTIGIWLRTWCNTGPLPPGGTVGSSARLAE